jgi:hypothetical protein
VLNSLNKISPYNKFVKILPNVFYDYFILYFIINKNYYQLGSQKSEFRSQDEKPAKNFKNFYIKINQSTNSLKTLLARNKPFLVS